VSEQSARPWALVRRHAGWADVFHIDSETGGAVHGSHPDRDALDRAAHYNAHAVLARFPTEQAARAAREAAMLEWRKLDAAVQAADAKLRDAEKAREDAWLNSLKGAAG
jgi:hypothetical protein